VRGSATAVVEVGVRIVKRQELMAMPAGTVYSEYQPHNFSGISVKGDTVIHGGKAIDFLMCGLIADFGGDSTTICDEMDRLARGEDIPQEFATCYGRDATFDDERQYAVWSEDDVIGLTEYLTHGRCRLARLSGE
jgi:hypothetical protein